MRRRENRLKGHDSYADRRCDHLPDECRSPPGPEDLAARPDEPRPHRHAVTLFLLLNLCEVVTFGLAISFLIWGWPWVMRVANSHRGRAVWMYVSIAWLLGNWFPHDNLHVHNGMNMSGLLFIEYGFHVSLMITGLILAGGFLAILREGGFGKADQAA